MHFTHKKMALFGLLASTIFAGPVAAGGGGGGDGGPSTDIFNPPHIYLTPGPNTLTYTIPDESGNTAGIPYSWTVNLGQKSSSTANGGQGGKGEAVIFGFFVGALSWNQPGFPQGTPGWTHNTNWIALNLAKPTIVTIQVGPSVPIPCKGTTQPAACDSTGRTGSDIYPAISLYQGQDNSTKVTDDHVFNPTGPFWANIQYKDSSSRSDPITHVLTYKTYLKAGQYTLNIGGAVALYNQSCGSTTTPLPPVCVGGKSYQAQITTSSAW
jgi:hypothetical protein